ncbi:prenyltransferase/squalene oxidase repeat-containing protein [Bacillus spongiae]|uniref:Prenyltransferase/squalene oxidase repeat-containing protein n=1 Tax=Bacillus spongiae TaxID=2683610 RepID=A0ABU8HJM1_9BACI
MKEAARREISRLIGVLRDEQCENGSWDYPFDTGIKTDAYMIILLRSLKMRKYESLIQELVERIESEQDDSTGGWKLFSDEKGANLSLTIEAYYALLYSRYRTGNEDNMVRAKQMILTAGGIEKADMFTKITLAITGQFSWPSVFPIPVELMLLPPTFPISFFDISVFGRANLVPILLLGDAKYQRKTKNSPNLSSLSSKRDGDGWQEYRANDWKNFTSNVKQGTLSLIGLPWELHRIAKEKAKTYMLERIEPDGTLLSYFSATFFMIFALMSLGYKRNDSTIQEAVQGLVKMKCSIKGHTHMQYTTANVWNTTLISHALQVAGVNHHHSMIVRANEYLVKRQQVLYGDWYVNAETAVPGGWGFSHINTLNPDVDDTTAALRAIVNMVYERPALHGSWSRGVSWILSMQNDDGGWPAFERKVNKRFVHLLPVQKPEFLLTDPSTADLTGRTLEYLGNYVHLMNTYPNIQQGKEWLYRNQKRDGSWYGRWGICYIYGTWSALTGLIAVGERSDKKAIQKAVTWLKSIQNKDGGWGESCLSDIEKKYIPLNSSTLTHTAWAVDALLAVEQKSSPAIEKGIQFLIKEGEKQDWTTEYPKGQGMAASFYIHYHSYRYIFPLIALSHYVRAVSEK